MSSAKRLVGSKHIPAQIAHAALRVTAGATDPATERRAFDFDAMMGKDLRLPIDRRVIAYIADEDMCEQRRDCKTAGRSVVLVLPLVLPCCRCGRHIFDA